MKSIVTIILCLAAMFSYSQAVHIDSISTYYLPEDTCNSYLAYHAKYGSSSSKLGTTIEVNGDSINVVICYRLGSSSIVTRVHDTICLGYLNENSYTIRVTATATYGNCTSFFRADTAYTTLQIGTVGISEATESKLQLYPNPVENTLHCSLAGNSLSATYAIHNIHGAMVTGSTAIQHLSFDIDISQLPSGIYCLTVNNDKQRYVKKFVKQ